MRIFLSHRRFAWHAAALFCAAIFLYSVSAWAIPTRASLEHSRDRIASSHHPRHRQTAQRRSRRTARSKTSVAAHRSRARHSAAARRETAALHRRRLSADTPARRRSASSALDAMRDHSTQNSATANGSNVDSSPELPETSAASSFVPSPQPAVMETERNLPAFHLGVPTTMPVALRGTHDVLVHQNIVADVEGLTRIENDDQLRAMVHAGDLVPLPASGGITIDPRLPLNRRYCRSWTAKFLADLSAAHERLFGDSLILTSAVRTVEFQRHLARYNGNAAPYSGDTASPHLTGEAIDIGKKGMSSHEIAWMRAVLGELQNRGKLDVEEEFHQACFHISVYKTYVPGNEVPAGRTDDRLIANSQAPAVQDQDAPSSAAIGELAKPVSEPVAHTVSVRRSHPVERHAVYSRRRHRRHHSSMSLLATRLR